MIAGRRLRYDGLYFTPFSAAVTRPSLAGRTASASDDPADVISLTNRRWLRELRGPNIRLFEWYFNITKGPSLYPHWEAEPVVG